MKTLVFSVNDLEHLETQILPNNIMTHFIVTGPVGGSTEGALAPNRLEINDFIKNDKFFSLYIQAIGKPR